MLKPFFKRLPYRLSFFRIDLSMPSDLIILLFGPVLSNISAFSSLKCGKDNCQNKNQYLEREIIRSIIVWICWIWVCRLNSTSRKLNTWETLLKKNKNDLQIKWRIDKSIIEKQSDWNMRTDRLLTRRILLVYISLVNTSHIESNTIHECKELSLKRSR